MLTWNVTYHCKSGQREAFYQALCDLGIRANSLKEEGNLKYDYFLAAEAPDDLLLVESWTTPELQQAHCQTEIFGRLQELRQRPNRQVRSLSEEKREASRLPLLFIIYECSAGASSSSCSSRKNRDRWNPSATAWWIFRETGRIVRSPSRSYFPQVTTGAR